MKRCLDLVVSTVLLVLLSPLLLAIALAVKLDSPGPALFRQEREGFLLHRFHIFKFRSLHIEAEDRSGIAQVEVGDTRVTRVGRFLRRTSFDELPQLINIFLGQMSLVGPRPHVPGMWAADRPYTVLVPYYRTRRLAKPGLTGWAQANGLRGPTGIAATAIERVDHDIAYIQNFSFWLDIRIIVMTALHEITHLGRGH